MLFLLLLLSLVIAVAMYLCDCFSSISLIVCWTHHQNSNCSDFQAKNNGHHNKSEVAMYVFAETRRVVFLLVVGAAENVILPNINSNNNDHNKDCDGNRAVGCYFYYQVHNSADGWFAVAVFCCCCCYCCCCLFLLLLLLLFLLLFLLQHLIL